MIRIVHPFVTSKVGIALSLLPEFAFDVIPLPAVLPRRGNIVTVEKPVGPGKDNQKTDVLLVRVLLNFLAAVDSDWRSRFGGKPLPHVPTFDAEVSRRVTLYQQAGGFRMPLRRRSRPGGEAATRTLRPVGDLPPLPPVPPNPPAPPPGPLPPDPVFFVTEPLFVDGIVDPCQAATDRGSKSNLVYTIVHLNYQLILRLGAAADMRLSPILLRRLRQLKDPQLSLLENELDEADRTDPDRPVPRPPSPAPPVPNIVI